MILIYYAATSGSMVAVPTLPNADYMARPAGLEPATLGLEGRCSIRLSYGRKINLPDVGFRG